MDASSENDQLENQDPFSSNISISARKTRGHLTWNLAFVVIAAAFGCNFPIGYTAVVTNAPQNVLVQWIRAVECDRFGRDPENSTFQTSNETNDNDPSQLWCSFIPVDEERFMLERNPSLNLIWSTLSSIPALGGFLSVLAANILITRFGNKNSLLLNNFTALIGCILCGSANAASSYELLIIGRIVLGFNLGLTLSVMPLYISELSPTNVRGAIGAIPQVFFALGSLCATFFGTPLVFGTRALWPYLFFIRIIPVALLFLTLPFCPESPRHSLLIKKNRVTAEKALIWLRGTKDISAEVEMMLAEEKLAQEVKAMTVMELLRDRFNRKLTIICITLALCQQFSGIGPVNIYSTAIFEAAGLGTKTALMGTIGIPVLSLISIFVAMATIDRLGRKILLAGGYCAAVICHIGLVAFMTSSSNGCSWCSYGSMVCVLLFIVVFSAGPGLVPAVLEAEVFSQSARGAAVVMIQLFGNGASLFVQFVFPLLMAEIEQWTFAICAGIVILLTAFFWVRMTETKGKDVVVIQEELRRLLLT